MAYPTRHLAPDALDIDYRDAEDGDSDVVADCFICPGCGENRVDWLAWDEDGTVVTCTTCGASYDPSEV